MTDTTQDESYEWYHRRPEVTIWLNGIEREKKRKHTVASLVARLGELEKLKGDIECEIYEIRHRLGRIEGKAIEKMMKKRKKK